MRVGAAAAFVVLLLLVAAVVFRASVLRGAVAVAGRAAGYDVSYGDLDNRDGRLTVGMLDVSTPSGEPVLTVQRVTIAYDVRDLFNSPYAFGIHGVVVERPKLTIIHHRDGTYNVALPAGNGSASAKPPQLPRIEVAVRDGSIGILDRTRIFAHSRRLAIEGIQIAVSLEPHTLSHADFALAVLEDGGRFPIHGRGTFDERRGLELARIAAPAIALGPLVDYALNSTALHIAGGELLNVDARIYGLADRDGTMHRHLSATADLDHFQPYLNGLVKPLRDGRGRLQVYDDGLTIPRVDGSIAGIPVRIAGAIYHLSQPALRLGIAGRGDLRALLTLSDAAKRLALSGPLAFALFVEGDATAPTTFASFASPRVMYGRIPIDRPAGLVALAGPETSILHASAGYDGMNARVRGAVTLRKHTDVELAADVDAPAQRVPYAAQLLGPMRVDASAVTSGTDARLATAGVISGATATRRLGGTFAVDGDGIGSIGPIAIAGPGGRGLYARVALDRPRAGGGAAFVSAQDLAIATGGRQPALPGVAIPALPPASGTLDADVAVAFAGRTVAGGGAARVRAAHVLGYPIDDVSARGTFAAPQRLAIDARYRGSASALARAARSGVAATGTLDIPVSVVVRDAGHVTAQIHDAHFNGVRVAGVSINGLEATAILRGHAVDVPGARVRIGGNDVVARGSFGNGGSLLVSAAGVALAPFRALGIPVTSGTASALATIRGTSGDPRVDGAVAASDVALGTGPAAGIGISANTALAYAGGNLHVRNTLVRAGPAVGSVDGDVNGLRSPSTARYALDARVRQADIATLARVAKAPLSAPQGTLDADVRVAGAGASPAISGRIAIPEGSLNGLRFRDASVALGGSASALRATNGSVTVGSSVLAFDAAANRSVQSFALHAPHVDLADFNDYFDRGDTLGGRGSIDAGVRNSPDAIVTSGRVRLTHAAFRRFELGTSRADWSTAGRRVRTDIALGSKAGRFTTRGTVTLAQSQPLRDALHRTSVALDASARGVDLDTWLPAAGIAAPVAGLVDADASVRGAYPNVDVDVHGSVAKGSVNGVALREATLDVRARRGRAALRNAVLAVDGARASATGTAGLAPGAPFDVTVAADSPDVAALAKTLTGKRGAVSGAVRTTVRLSGTARRPLARGVLDADAIRYADYTVPHAHAEASVTRLRAQLTTAEVDLRDGRIVASGFAPLGGGAQPLTLPRHAPIGLDLHAERVGLAQFAGLLPKGTQLDGTLDGTLGVRGSLADPGLDGTLALANGSFSGPQERSRISKLAAAVTFAGHSATLHDAVATVGGGTVAASGRASVGDLANPVRSLAANLQATSNGAVFDVPGLLRGRIDGTLTVARAPASNALIGGNLTFTSTRIATTALLPKAPAAESSAAPLPVSLDLGVVAGSDVRVQGGPVDIGAQGTLHVGGTASAPAVTGQLESTGGTISFYRTFRLQYPSTVTFEADNGVVPTIDALATSTVDNPPTTVDLHVTGLATQLNVALASDPSYSREQILGLLVGAQALGAVSGVQTAQGGPQQNPFQAAAAGQLGTLLTQNVLEPFSSQLGGAVGLNNLAINYAPGGSVDVGAQKKILKNLSAVFAESFNYPQRQSIGLLASPNDATAVQLTFFSQPTSNRFDTFQGIQSLNSTNTSVTDAQPVTGGNGFSFSLQRKFR